MRDSGQGSISGHVNVRFCTWKYLRIIRFAILNAAVFTGMLMVDSGSGSNYGNVDCQPWTWQYVRSGEW